MSEVFENPEDKAKRYGLVLRRPKGHELFVDIDNERDLRAFDERLDLFERMMGVHVDGVRENPSMSGHPNTHIVVRLADDVSTEQRIFYEVLLGSDIKRAILGMGQVHASLGHDSSVFFEAPGFVEPLEADTDHDVDPRE